MSYLVKNPVIGALLNVINYGLADVYVGHFATGIFKLVFITIVKFATIGLVRYLSDYYPVEMLNNIVMLIYIPFALITGYVTVLKSREETYPSN